MEYKKHPELVRSTTDVRIRLDHPKKGVVQIGENHVKFGYFCVE